MGGRFFQGLEDGIECLLRKHVHFVNNVYLEARGGGGIADILADLAHFVDAAIGGAVNLNHIHALADGNCTTMFTLAARGVCRPLCAVEGLGKNPRH